MEESTHSSLVREEFRERDFGDRSKSLSDLYKKDSRLWGKFWSTSPEEGLIPSRGLRFGDAPFSTSKLKRKESRIIKQGIFTLVLLT